MRRLLTVSLEALDQTEWLEGVSVLARACLRIEIWDMRLIKAQYTRSVLESRTP